MTQETRDLEQEHRVGFLTNGSNHDNPHSWVSSGHRDTPDDLQIGVDAVFDIRLDIEGSGDVVDGVRPVAPGIFQTGSESCVNVAYRRRLARHSEGERPNPHNRPYEG